MPKKLLLIDGHSIIHRAFYGLPDLTSADGRHTGAVYGFLTILFRFIEEEKPDALAVAFDVHAPTFRHAIFADYKGKRKPMPEELRSQIPLLKEVLDAMGVFRMEQAGLEADDLMGTAAKRSEKFGWTSTIVSGDRDLLQVATDGIIVAMPKTVRGQTTVVRYDAQAVLDEWGVNGERFIDLKALMGDTSDNIPGLPKVGEKTAMDLMKQFGSGEAIFARSGEITKKGLRQTVEEHRADYDLSRTLATINIDAPYEFRTEQALLPGGDFHGYFTPAAYELYKQLGFRKLLHYFEENAGAQTPAARQEAAPMPEAAVVHNTAEAARAFADLAEAGGEYIGIAFVYDHNTEDTSRIDPVDCVGVCAYAEGVTPVYAAFGGDFSAAEIRGEIERLSAVRRLAVFDAKEAYRFFTPARILYDENPALPQVFDTNIAAYLLNPLKNDYTPEDIAITCLSETPRSRKEIFDKARFVERPEDARIYAVQTARIQALAAPVLNRALDENGMRALYEEMELPLSFILYDMERLGIRVRRQALRDYGDRLTGRIEELETAIYEAAGGAFNILSPKQLGEILFEKLGFPGGKKTKTGYSTAADVLEKLAPESQIVRDVLEYRTLTKLKSTYADGLDAFILADDRIHTCFHQTITATGRISSSEPNLQNIPMRTALGREIRRVFVPEDGFVFTDADYSQIELRILAAMSGDEALIRAYHENRDIHAITASRVFHVPFDEVTPLMRRNAKAVNFGIVYGISSFGLSQDLSISRSEAAAYIEQYFATYPGVKTFLDRLVSDAKEKGYAETLYHRRRPMPELKSSNFMQRSFGERVAMNAPIQGTAADIMKLAMIRVWARIRRENLRSRMILQIHDELLIETAAGEEEQVLKILTEEMMHAADLAVPLETDCHAGADWFEAKG